MARVFEAVTEWLANGYRLRIRTGCFSTREQADAFGTQPLRLAKNFDRLVLVNTTINRAVEIADDSCTDVMIVRRNSDVDLLRVELPITKFGADLANFRFERSYARELGIGDSTA